MDVSQTAKGTPCKLCSAKQKKGLKSKCHLHRESPSPKRLPTEFQYFEQLPKEVLPNILLNLDWITLSRVCHHVPKVREICRQPNFQKAYFAKIKHLFVNPRLVETRTKGLTKYFEDDNKTKIEFNYSIKRGVATNILIVFSSGINMEFWLLEIDGDRKTFGFINNSRNKKARRKDFNKLHRPELFNLPYEQQQKIVITELKRALGDQVPKGIFDDYQTQGTEALRQ